MTTLKGRLEKLEAQRAGPVEIRVFIVDNGRYWPAGTDLNGPGLSEEEYRAQFPDDENTRTFLVGYEDTPGGEP